MTNEYISLEVLSKRLRLPPRFLRKEAEAGRIPCLKVGGRLRFEEAAVAEALRRQAERREAIHA
jgi:excisionase family DNA binding protein